MTQDLTVVPGAALDKALTPTQRFEMIARAQQGMQDFSAPESDRPTVRAGGLPVAVIERAQYLERCRDNKGMVTAREYAASGVWFTFNYDIPDDYAFEPVNLRTVLECAAKARVPKKYVFDFLVEFGKIKLPE